MTIYNTEGMTMRIKYLIAVILFGSVQMSVSMPSEQEFATARAVVADVMESELAAMKEGKKKPSEVADYALSLMSESETAVAKYLLAGRAYALYVKGGDYSKAVKAIDEMQGAVPDMPYDCLLKTIMPAMKGLPEKKAPELYARIAELKGRVHSQSEISKLTAELAKAKASERRDIHCKLGNNYTVLNDWKNALEHFAKVDGKVSEVAQSELAGAGADAKIAGFWWDWAEENGLSKSIASACRAHAAELYRNGLDAGTITGLSKRIAEQRVKAVVEAKEGATAKSPFRIGVAAGVVCTIALSDKCNMDFVYCPAGFFKMGYEEAEKVAPVRQIQITRPFWMSKCRVTFRQMLNMGVKVEDSDQAAKVHDPIATIDMFSAALTTKFGHLLPKGYVFRVCTEAEYEYVAKAKATKSDPRLTWNYSQPAVNSPWGVEDMFKTGTIICFEDTVPYDDGTLWARTKKGATSLKVMDYSKQPKKDPILRGNTSLPIHLRREFKGKPKEKFKLTAQPDGKDMGRLWGSQFYLVAAPSVDTLNKFP